MLREAVVAGQFYHGHPKMLLNEVQSYLIDKATKQDAIAVMSPHAGLMYSGHVAGAVYSHISGADTFLLLGPNHTGLGAKCAIMSEGMWQTPLGSVAIDTELADNLKSLCPLIKEDSLAHLHEHSLEVQLPFIQSLFSQSKILPIAIMKASVEECAVLGSAIAEAISLQKGKKVVIVSSTDMSHYVSDATARQLDGLAIKKVLDLDPEGLYQTVYDYRISMCGVLPTTVMLFACKNLGATKTELIKYATSGEINADMHRVVGYAGVIIS